MFEMDQPLVESLRGESSEFARLLKQHTELKAAVRSAELGVTPRDHLEIGAMKREKLICKDRLTEMFNEYRRSHSAA